MNKHKSLPPGTIIFLNGTSSSGKTTLLKSLQTAIDEPLLDMGIDRFIWMMPKRYLDRPLWDNVLGKASYAGAAGHRLVSAMHHAILAVSALGNCVVADHVLVEPDWVRECAELFWDKPAWLVGVRCPLEVVEERERSRKDRTLGQARAQFELVHHHGVYDIEVDTSVMNPSECAEMIKKAVLMGKEPKALSSLRSRLPG